MPEKVEQLMREGSMKKFPRSASRLNNKNAANVGSMARMRASQVRLRRPPRVGAINNSLNPSPSQRATVAQFSLCKNNREYKLQEIVRQYEDLKTLTNVRTKIKDSN